MNKGDHVGLASTFEALINQIKTKLSAKADKNALGTAAAKDVGTANGVAELDSSGKVPSSQLPSYVDDVLEYTSTSAFPSSGEAGKIYVAKDTNKTYRWSGSEYVEISASLALGETSSTAYRGDRGKTAYDFSQAPYTSNPPMNGTASAGSSNSWARGDHVHPKDTSKMDVSGGTFTGDIYTRNAYADGSYDFYVEMHDTESVYYMGLRDVISNLENGLSKRNNLFYAECTTAASTAAKTVTLASPNNNYTPVAGDFFLIKLTNRNTVLRNITLNINDKGAYPWTGYKLSDDLGSRDDYSYFYLVHFDGSTYHTMLCESPGFAGNAKTADESTHAAAAGTKISFAENARILAYDTDYLIKTWQVPASGILVLTLTLGWNSARPSGIRVQQSVTVGGTTSWFDIGVLSPPSGFGGIGITNIPLSIVTRVTKNENIRIHCAQNQWQASNNNYGLGSSGISGTLSVQGYIF